MISRDVCIEIISVDAEKWTYCSAKRIKKVVLFFITSMHCKKSNGWKFNKWVLCYVVDLGVVHMLSWMLEPVTTEINLRSFSILQQYDKHHAAQWYSLYVMEQFWLFEAILLILSTRCFCITCLIFGNFWRRLSANSTLIGDSAAANCTSHEDTRNQDADPLSYRVTKLFT